MIGFWGSFIYGLYLLPGFCFQTEYWIVWKILFVIVWVIVLSYMFGLGQASLRLFNLLRSASPQGLVSFLV